MNKVVLNFVRYSLLGILFYSCQNKDLTPSVTSADEALATYQSVDAHTIMANVDASLDEVYRVINKISRTDTVCSTKLDSSTFSGNSAVILYNNNCGSTKSKMGSLIVNLKSKASFSDSLATYTIVYNNLVLAQTANGNTYLTTITGSVNGINFSKGTPYSATTVSGRKFNTKIYGRLSIRFENDTMPRIWNIARKMIWTRLDSVNYSVKVYSDSTLSSTNSLVLGALTGVEIAGKDRYGNPFYTQFQDTLIINKKKCSNFFPVSGSRKHYILTSKSVISSNNTIFQNSGGCSQSYSLFYLNNTTGASATKSIIW